MKNYEKLEFIYGNGHDKVYACVSKKDRRKYAMKFINIPTKEFQKQNREVELYQKLHHENLIYMEECFSHQQQNMRYMVTVMEYCSEGDLNDVIGNPRYDFMDLLTFMLEISKGVLYLHSSKVVHRDIKAENVLLMRNKIKITDFGLSKVMISNKSNRSNNMTKGIGTYSYMSPEMLDKQDYSYEVDIWAMGILFIEMVVGERISAIEQDQFPQKKPDFPNQKLMGRIRWPPLKRVIENMVKRDRHHRWKIDQIVEELSKFERDMSAQSKRESIPISLPLIFDDLNLSAKFKKEYRIDLGKKSVQPQQIKLMSTNDDQITIIYKDYEELMTLEAEAWLCKLEYTYNMLQPQIREKFANLNDVFCQLKKQDGKLQLQTTGFIIGTISYRIKQDMFKEGQKKQAQKMPKAQKLPKAQEVPKAQKLLKEPTKVSDKPIQSVIKVRSKQISFKKEDEEQQIVEQSTNASTSGNVSLVRMSHRQKKNLHCHFIKFIHQSGHSQPNEYQPSGEPEQAKTIEEREDEIKTLQKSKNVDNDQLFLRYRQLGRAYMEEKGSYKLGLQKFKKAKDVWEVTKKEKNKDYIQLVETIGELQLRCDNPNQSLNAFNQSLSLRRKTSSINPDIECKTFNFMGIIFFQLSQYEKAEQNFFYSLDVLMTKNQEETNEYRGVVYHNIGNIYNVQLKDADAIINYAQAINSFGRTFNSNYTRNIVESCESLCGIYFSHKNYESGIEYFEKMLITINMEGNIKSPFNIQYIKGCFCEWFGPLINHAVTKATISAILQQKLIDIFCSYLQGTPFFVQTCFKFKTDPQP